jgi:hypothetical protein
VHQNCIQNSSNSARISALGGERSLGKLGCASIADYTRRHIVDIARRLTADSDAMAASRDPDTPKARLVVPTDIAKIGYRWSD